MSPNHATTTPVRRFSSAFTLIELLVVIAIIAILAAILFPVFAQAREKARQSACLSNMKQIMTAVKMYTQDYDERGPYDWYTRNATPGVFPTWMETVNPYVKNNDIWVCPSSTGEKSDNPTLSAICNGGPTKVYSYFWMAWFPYDYWDMWGQSVMFGGFPTENEAVCPAAGRPWAACRGIEQVEEPARSVFIVEGGYFIAYYPVAGTQLGSACNAGIATDPLNYKHYYRHNRGQNAAYADGHVKWMRDNFLSDTSARTTGDFSGYPASPHMRVGK